MSANANTNKNKKLSAKESEKEADHVSGLNAQVESGSAAVAAAGIVPMVSE